ncbi:hypothetical protein [Shimia ponticola]|uniref:hypothetical protein n=1 Tax=Shimia ponticola TaxID=2582893 RepID=UPI0011BEA6F2|nr:hypothetical protein [Shimia ponticola]
MCISSAALAAFLTLVGVDHVELGDDRVVVKATTRDAHWVADGDLWCTMAPQIDRMARVTQAAAE